MDMFELNKIRERYQEVKYRDSVNRRSQAAGLGKNISHKSPEEMQKTFVENSQVLSKMIKEQSIPMLFND